MRILLIEDEKDVADSIKESLKPYYITDLSYSGKAGSYKAHIKDYDLIVIDYMLPDIDGLEVCKQIRQEGNSTPIMFLTARYQIRSKIEALDAGADDYLVKPFSTKELLARIRAILRRNVGHYERDVLTINNLCMDTIQRTVKQGETDVQLRKKAFDLLEYMIRNKNRVLTRDMIIEHVWEHGSEELSNTVDVHIKYLRDRIDKPFNTQFIKTVHGLGYTFSHDAQRKGGDTYE